MLVSGRVIFGEQDFPMSYHSHHSHHSHHSLSLSLSLSSHPIGIGEDTLVTNSYQTLQEFLEDRLREFSCPSGFFLIQALHSLYRPCRAYHSQLGFSPQPSHPSHCWQYVLHRILGLMDSMITKLFRYLKWRYSPI